MQIGARKVWNLLVISIICDYGVEKINKLKDKNIKKTTFPFHSKQIPTKIYLGRTKLINLKIPPFPLP